MQVRIKIWRFDSQTGERALKEYEIEAPEWVDAARRAST